VVRQGRALRRRVDGSPQPPLPPHAPAAGLPDAACGLRLCQHCSELRGPHPPGVASKQSGKPCLGPQSFSFFPPLRSWLRRNPPVGRYACTLTLLQDGPLRRRCVVLWASLHSTAAEFPKQQLRPLSTSPLPGRQISAEGPLALSNRPAIRWRNTSQGWLEGHEAAGGLYAETPNVSR